MKFTLSLLLPFAFFAQLCGQSPTARQYTMDSLDALRIEYIADNKDYAIREMQRSGIPASITLAQGILESAAGTSFLAQSANNHFGLKCGDRWSGSTAYKHDDDFDKNGKPLKSCFRSYTNAGDNYADHSSFLRDPQKTNRYGALFLLDPLDYVAWATGLQAAGYSPVGHYSARLIEFIERYHLHELDYQAWNHPQLSGRARYFDINGKIAVFAYEGESIEDIASDMGLSADNLVLHNDNYYKTTTRLTSGTPIFLEGKNSTWEGSELEYYFSHDGKTLFEIGQIFGIQLEALREMNNLKPGQEPALSAKIRLQGVHKNTDKVALRTGTLPRATQPKPRNKKPPMAPVKYALPVNDENVSNLKQVLATPVKATAMRPVNTYTSARSSKSVTSEQPDYEVTTGSLVYHEVQIGDTLVAIARKYNVSIENLKKLNTNTVQGDKIKAGQRLRVK